MAPHLTHMGVHDHGFNNVSTYGTLWRLAREGRFDAERLGVAVLRARAEGQRRGPGAALDAPAGRRLHPLVQRRALALRRHDPLAARPRARLPARPAAARGAGRRGQPARSAGAARARDGAVQRLLRPRPRSLRRARPRRAREPLQRRQRHLPRAEHAAGLLAVHDLDARPRVGDARVRRGARVPRVAAGRRARRVGRPRGGRRMHARGRARHLRSLHRRSPPPTACRTGMPARRASRRSAPGAIGRRIRSTTASRSTVPRPRSARRVCCASPTCSSAAAIPDCRQRYRQAGLRVVDTLVRRVRAVSERRPGASGAAAAFGLSLAQRLGLRAARRVRSRVASRANGATITRARWRSTCMRLAEDAPYLTFFGPPPVRLMTRAARPSEDRR